MTALAIVGSAISTSLMSRGKSMTMDLLTPSATACDPLSSAAILIDCIGGWLIGASPASASPRAMNHDTTIRPTTAAARIDLLVAMVKSLRADQRDVDTVLTP